MKNIIDKCKNFNQGKYIENSVKLRLRGRGSGFREGQNNQGFFPLLIRILRTFTHVYIFQIYRKNFKLLVNYQRILYIQYNRFCEINIINSQWISI